MLHSHCSLLAATAGSIKSQEESADKRLCLLLEEFMEIYVSSRAKHVVLLNDLHWLSSEQQETVRNLERQVVQTFRELVSAIRPGIFPRTNAASSLHGPVGIAELDIYMVQPGGDLSPQSFAQITARTFLAGISAANA